MFYLTYDQQLCSDSCSRKHLTIIITQVGIIDLFLSEVELSNVADHSDKLRLLAETRLTLKWCQDKKIFFYFVILTPLGGLNFGT